MKKLLFVGVIIVTAVACKQKVYECAYRTSHIGAWVMLSGFSQTELDTVYVMTYSANSNRSQLLKSETVLGVNLICSHGSAVINDDSSSGWFSITDNQDYQIVVPAVHANFVISKAGYQYYPIETFTREGSPCRDVVSVVGPDSAYVNGALLYSNHYNGATRVFELNK